MIRPATVRDVPAMARLISTFAQRGKMLFRSHAELYETVRNFVVEEQRGAVIGVCALDVVWSDLGEVRSLAVDASCQGQGIGRRLVEAVIDQARHLQVQRVFALTYEQAFFEKLGFHAVDKSALPLKVWSECIRCPKREGCDEIAMVRTILDQPAVAEDDPNQHAELRYEVPTPLVQIRIQQEKPGARSQ